MNVSSITKIGSQAVGKGLLLAKKFSPEILTGAGIVGVVVAGVFAAKATLKLEDKVDEFQTDIYNVKKKIEANKSQNPGRDKTKVYVVGSLRVVKLYAPSVGLAVVSIGCILAGHGIMRRRVVSVMAAYSVLDKSFSNYRNRVIEEFGIEKDREYTSGERKIEQINETTGKKELVTVKDPSGLSPYAKFFDEGSTQWDRTPEYNLVFLKCQQEYANQRLQARGHLLLNDVYDSLGIERTSAGCVVGWKISKDGDNFVDFGMYDAGNSRFINSEEASILLDFNVDGVIYDQL